MPAIPARVIFTLRAFRHRNYRLFFMGQGISLIGTWMQSVTLGYLTYRLTNSAFLLGMVGFASQIPTVLFTPLGGVAADRKDRRTLLLITQSLAMVQASLLAALTLTGTIEVWHIITLSVFLGCINAFDIPTRQSFIVEMVESRADLSNAIALNSTMFNGARLIGPSVGGLLIATTGEGICFLINAISFSAALAALALMRITPVEQPAEHPPVFRQLKEGFSYAFGLRPIKYILLLLGLTSFVGMPYAVLMPVFAKDILHGDARTLGFLMSAAGVGAIFGAIRLASRKNTAGLGRDIARPSLLFGLCLTAFSFSRSLPFSLALMAVAGGSVMTQMASGNTILQTIVDDKRRGSVMSLYALSFGGMMPLGSLVAGSLAHAIGVPHTLFIAGVVCIAGALAFRSRLKKIIL